MIPLYSFSRAAYAWGRKSFVRSLRSRVWACFDYQNNSQHIHTAPWRNICSCRCILCPLLPNDIRVLFHEKALFLRFTFSFTSLIPCLLPPREERETTERTAAQRPANKKCCLLIFAIAIGCLVLADFPVVNFSTRSQFLPTQDYLFLFYFVSIASISSIASMFSCYWFSDCDSACEKIHDFTQEIKFSSKKVHFSDMCKQIFRQRR